MLLMMKDGITRGVVKGREKVKVKIKEKAKVKVKGSMFLKKGSVWAPGPTYKRDIKMATSGIMATERDSLRRLTLTRSVQVVEASPGTGRKDRYASPVVSAGRFGWMAYQGKRQQELTRLKLSTYWHQLLAETARRCQLASRTSRSMANTATLVERRRAETMLGSFWVRPMLPSLRFRERSTSSKRSSKKAKHPSRGWWLKCCQKAENAR